MIESQLAYLGAHGGLRQLGDSECGIFNTIAGQIRPGSPDLEIKWRYLAL